MHKSIFKGPTAVATKMPCNATPDASAEPRKLHAGGLDKAARLGERRQGQAQLSDRSMPCMAAPSSNAVPNPWYLVSQECQLAAHHGCDPGCVWLGCQQLPGPVGLQVGCPACSGCTEAAGKLVLQLEGSRTSPPQTGLGPRSCWMWPASVWLLADGLDAAQLPWLPQSWPCPAGEPACPGCLAEPLCECAPRGHGAVQLAEREGLGAQIWQLLPLRLQA